MVGLSWLELAAVASAIGFAAVASASETIDYSYDARVRLVKVERSTPVNVGVTTNYSYDKADNRTRVKATGSPNHPPP